LSHAPLPARCNSKLRDAGGFQARDDVAVPLGACPHPYCVACLAGATAQALSDGRPFACGVAGCGAPVSGWRSRSRRAVVHATVGFGRREAVRVQEFVLLEARLPEPPADGEASDCAAEPGGGGGARPRGRWAWMGAGVAERVDARTRKLGARCAQLAADLERKTTESNESFKLAAFLRDQLAAEAERRRASEEAAAASEEAAAAAAAQERRTLQRGGERAREQSAAAKAELAAVRGELAAARAELETRAEALARAAVREEELQEMMDGAFELARETQAECEEMCQQGLTQVLKQRAVESKLRRQKQRAAPPPPAAPPAPASPRRAASPGRGGPGRGAPRARGLLRAVAGSYDDSSSHWREVTARPRLAPPPPPPRGPRRPRRRQSGGGG